MRIVLDTNVFVSGVFFGGWPRRVLESWRDGQTVVVFSREILEEYRRFGDRLAERYPGAGLHPFLRLLTIEGELVDPPLLDEPITDDPDDDKFLTCAWAAGIGIVVSGDGDLLKATGWKGIEVLTPAEFVRRFLEGQVG